MNPLEAFDWVPRREVAEFQEDRADAVHRARNSGMMWGGALGLGAGGTALKVAPRIPSTVIGQAAVPVLTTLAGAALARKLIGDRAGKVHDRLTERHLAKALEPEPIVEDTLLQSDAEFQEALEWGRERDIDIPRLLRTGDWIPRYSGRGTPRSAGHSAGMATLGALGTLGLLGAAALVPRNPLTLKQMAVRGGAGAAALYGLGNLSGRALQRSTAKVDKSRRELAEKREAHRRRFGGEG